MATKRILVSLSGSPYTRAAIDHAIELAKRHDADLTGVTVVDSDRLARVGPIPIGGGAAASDLTRYREEISAERVEQCIAQFQDECRQASLACSVVRETGDALNELISLWRYHDLTIMGLRGLFEYGVVHNPDDVLIRLVTRGIRPILAVSDAFRPIKRVLIAYNGSLEAAKAMKRFAQMQLWVQPAVRVVCYQQQADDAARLLSDAANYLSAHGIDAEYEASDVDPRDGIIQDIDAKGIDLVVIGSTARSWIARQVLGDTVLYAIRHAAIPLFLAR